MAEITSTGPVALLALLQTRAANDSSQYSTLVAVDKESLRRNTYTFLPQPSDDTRPFMPLDVDGLVVDYFRNTSGTEGYTVDLGYLYRPPDTTNRYLKPYNGAGIAPLGINDSDAFNTITLPYLKGLSTYTQTGTIELSGANFQVGFTFAVRTALGNYAKARIAGIIDTEDGSRQNADLVLQVCIYK